MQMRSVTLLSASLLSVVAPFATLAATAQESKRVRTEIIRESVPGANILYAIEDDGTVRIDWDAAETLVISKADRPVLPIAQLMLAIRDRTWKPVTR